MEQIYIPTIGLEIHAELKTKSKMFCGCINDPDTVVPNTNICPVCMAHPGTLPVINREAVMQVLRVGVAVGGTLGDFTEFDRKNYFYPDIPKNYQISQYKHPLVSGGSIGGIDITRIHLEEDTARSSHTDGFSSIDFNRAGVPLMELVTEPVIHDAGTAVSFAKDLRLLLQYLDASNANLEKGEMRIEANISVSKADQPFGTKVEVKNLNSFKAVEQAIGYEFRRQTRVLTTGGTVVQETRGWNEDKQETFSQRIKEESHDYRYYPDPDLPKLYLKEIPAFEVAALRASLPILPWDLKKLYEDEGLKAQTIELLVANRALNSLFQATKKELSDKELTLCANYLTSDLLGITSRSDYKGKKLSEMNAAEFAALIMLIVNGAVSSRGAKEVLSYWVQKGGKPETIAKKLGVMQISNAAALEDVIQAIITENKEVVADYKSGKDAALQFLVGQGMKATKGAANPNLLQEMIKNKLK